VGTDLNRNYGYRWGCCGGSSGTKSSETYRGAAAFSAPETARVRDFINSRVIGGQQQISSSISFHTYSELVLWPYGYTYTDVPSDMSQDDRNVFATLGTTMADTNGYTPQQSSDLYITDGDFTDWAYGTHKMFAFTFEMYPNSAGGGGFYPPDEVIVEQTSRNREAVLYLAEQADCPYRVIGKEGQYCNGEPPPPVGGFYENAADTPIPDLGTVESSIATTEAGAAPTDLQVHVEIRHTYRGDLRIDVVAPDGTAYRVKNSSGSDGADNVNETYTVNASTEAGTGTWKLRVRDMYSSDTGFIDKWSLQF
jgi:hypothetical protein